MAEEVAGSGRTPRGLRRQEAAPRAGQKRDLKSRLRSRWAGAPGAEAAGLAFRNKRDYNRNYSTRRGGFAEARVKRREVTCRAGNVKPRGESGGGAWNCATRLPWLREGRYGWAARSRWRLWQKARGSSSITGTHPAPPMSCSPKSRPTAPKPPPCRRTCSSQALCLRSSSAPSLISAP